MQVTPNNIIAVAPNRSANTDKAAKGIALEFLSHITKDLVAPLAANAAQPGAPEYEMILTFYQDTINDTFFEQDLGGIKGAIQTIVQNKERDTHPTPISYKDLRGKKNDQD